MSLRNTVRRSARQGRQMRAIITDVHGSRADARLSENGAIVHNLPVIGGPVRMNQPVFVDYTTDGPTIVAFTNLDSVPLEQIGELAPLTLKGGGGSVGVSSHQYILEIPGNFTIGVQLLRAYNRFGVSYTTLEAHLSVSLAITGSDLIVDVNKNGITIFTNQANRPRILVGQYTGLSTAISVTPFDHGDYFTVAVEQGSGTNLAVAVLVG